jgi:hypothetical protein
MNSIIVELYELSDAMSFMEECLGGMTTRGTRQLAGNAYIIGLFGRRIAEIAELLEQDPDAKPEAHKGSRMASAQDMARSNT